LSTPVCLVAGRRGTDHTDDETNDVDLVVVVVVVVVDRRLMVSATPAGRFGRFVSFRSAAASREGFPEFPPVCTSSRCVVFACFVCARETRCRE
jgi:hypothetical protein